ncbi:TD and POZ domain-containing protein 2 [Caerostris darwini]|uniref:TD and POZ domain-containing protein 2 n=1 Tax=Caerostris darwini TaxID=1538125 RepID=A0AAV4S0U8_9ARAC|nr:TD and POZ domain-containing protein 2 [Caerostris darwini]
MAYETTKENEAFIFNWRVENYSLCPQKRQVPLESPSFIMGILDKTKWHISLYPKGKSDDFIVCDLHRENDTGTGSVSINTQFSFLLADGITKYEFKIESNSYTKQLSTSHRLMDRSKLLAKKHVLLPRDVLTIQCRMWKKDTQVTTIVPTAAVKTLTACLYGEKEAANVKLPDVMCITAETEIMNLKKKLYPYLNECSAKTRMGNEEISFVWPIKNFSSLKVNQSFSVPLVPASKKTPPLTLAVTLTSDDNVQINIHKIVEKETGEIFMICRMALMEINGREHIVSEKEHYFNSPTTNEEWNFPPFFKKTEIMEVKNVCLPNDILSLSFLFTISTGIEISIIDECNFVSLACEKSTNISDIGSLTEDIKAFYMDRKLFDVRLKVGEQTLLAHRAVLSSRSPVFRAMFEHDTKEKIKNEIDITDIDFKTLDRMLTFMYTDDTEFQSTSNAIKLYAVADKYQIESLRRKCSLFLTSKVNSRNVYSILVLSNLHQDKDLKKSAEELLFKPPYDALFSAEFEAFMKSNIELARETLHNWINGIKSEMALEF